MADISPVDEGNIQEEETQFQAAVSEYTARRMGSNLNYIRTYHIFDHTFKMNGPSSSFSGKTGTDGLFVFPYNAKIIDAIIYKETPGSSGQLQIDVQTSTFPNGTWTSIFSVIPIITSGAVASTTVGVGDVVAGTTAPVLVTSPVLVNAKDRVRIHVISTDTGFIADCGISIKYLPR